MMGDVAYEATLTCVHCGTRHKQTSYIDGRVLAAAASLDVNVWLQAQKQIAMNVVSSGLTHSAASHPRGVVKLALVIEEKIPA